MHLFTAVFFSLYLKKLPCSYKAPATLNVRDTDSATEIIDAQLHVCKV